MRVLGPWHGLLFCKAMGGKAQELRISGRFSPAFLHWQRNRGLTGATCIWRPFVFFGLLVLSGREHIAICTKVNLPC